MPLLKASIKANNQNIKVRARNTSQKKDLKEAIKRILDSALKGDLKEAEKYVSEAFSLIDKAVKKNILTKNTGARRKSLIHKALKKAGSKLTKFSPLVKEQAKKSTKKTSSAKKVVKKASKPTKK